MILVVSAHDLSSCQNLELNSSYDSTHSYVNRGITLFRPMGGSKPSCHERQHRFPKGDRESREIYEIKLPWQSTREDGPLLLPQMWDWRSDVILVGTWLVEQVCWAVARKVMFAS